MQLFKKGGDRHEAPPPVYARHASLAFNRRMHKILQDMCREIAAELGGSLRAILLGGNYGRGEGGVLRVLEGHGSGVWSIGEAPAEDIDILVIAWFNLQSRRERLSRILDKYSQIFSVPIDLAPIITPIRLLCVPKRFNWQRLMKSSMLLYSTGGGHLPLKRFRQRPLNPSLSWSLLLDQGLRLVDYMARERGLSGAVESGSPLAHQGKFFREIAAAVLLSRGKYDESADMQLHEYICLMDEEDGDVPRLKILKGFLPHALAILKNPQQGELDLPETWLYHLELWEEAYGYIRIAQPCIPGLLLTRRLRLCRRVITRLRDERGEIPESAHSRVKQLVNLLRWLRHHVNFS